jgi:hypothetical protein
MNEVVAYCEISSHQFSGRDSEKNEISQSGEKVTQTRVKIASTECW